jgi:hypothetical protein
MSKFGPMDAIALAALGAGMISLAATTPGLPPGGSWVAILCGAFVMGFAVVALVRSVGLRSRLVKTRGELRRLADEGQDQIASISPWAAQIAEGAQAILAANGSAYRKSAFQWVRDVALAVEKTEWAPMWNAWDSIEQVPTDPSAFSGQVEKYVRALSEIRSSLDNYLAS